MKSKRFTRKRKKRGGMFPGTKRRKSPTTAFAFSPQMKMNRLSKR